MTPAHANTYRAARRSFTLVEMLVAIGIIVILAVITVSATVALVERSEIRQTENILTLLDTAVIEWEAQSDRKITWGKEGVPFAASSYDMYDGVPHVFTLSEILYRIGRSDVVKPIIAQIKPEGLYRFDTVANPMPPGWIRLQQQGDPDPNFADAATDYGNGQLGPAAAPRTITGMLAVLDAWGNPIRAVHPGRAFDPVLFADDDGEEPDLDGTIPLNATGWPDTYGVEEFYGRASDRRILFVSAGPDGRFGNLASPHDGSEEERRLHEWAYDNVLSYDVEDIHDE